MSNFFDAEGFYAALDAHRNAKGITWKKVAEKTGVSPSTLTRMGQGKRPDVDSLAALASWSGIDVKSFYLREGEAPSRPETLAEITALLRADRELGKEGSAMMERMIISLYEEMRKRRDEQV
ncbi:helix-turn-helix domain-containing protein [Pelagibacterium xiamenense]|uniref:helix-turn-helix domain-containing protein n=1 Tax=Pelagibacterium xiamenense TaxID=2901140 RepID=UPI001E5AE3F8|nr:helix-turn-helix domain-containing protein [Pelagibacterium xiamenense]MCD7059110.1 helix-turn-helix domain-containing protein [Pelagibacterium xiamenense]